MKKGLIVSFVVAIISFAFSIPSANAQSSVAPSTVSTAPAAETPKLNPYILGNEFKGNWFTSNKESPTITKLQVRDGATCDYTSKGKMVTCPITVETLDIFVLHHPDGVDFRFKLKDGKLWGDDLKNPNWRVILEADKKV